MLLRSLCIFPAFSKLSDCVASESERTGHYGLLEGESVTSSSIGLCGVGVGFRTSSISFGVMWFWFSRWMVPAPQPAMAAAQSFHLRKLANTRTTKFLKTALKRLELGVAPKRISALNAAFCK